MASPKPPPGTTPTRVNVPNDLHRQAKATAALLGVTLHDYQVAALAEAVMTDPDAATVRAVPA